MVARSRASESEELCRSAPRLPALASLPTTCPARCLCLGVRVGDSLPLSNWSSALNLAMASSVEPLSLPLTIWTGVMLKSVAVLLASPPRESLSAPFLRVNSSSALATTREKVERPRQLLCSVLLKISRRGVKERR